MTLVKFQPRPFQTLLNDLINDVWSAQSWEGSLDRSYGKSPARPAVNIAETATGFRLDVAAPGFAKEDFTVKVEKDLLTIAAKKEAEKTEEGTTWKRREFGFTTFERSFTLPETVDTDNLKAAYANGILTVELTRKPELQPVVRTVEIA